MKIEMGLGGGVWDDEHKAMVAAILGTRAFDYLILSSICRRGDEGLVGWCK